MTYLAAVTRDIWAFARDQGLPFSTWLAHVDQKRHIPVRATFITSCCSIALSLIYIGSPVAFYAITSLLAVALLQCYCVSIGCLLWRRIKYPETLPPAKFSLGRWGVPCNIAAVIYSAWCFFWCFWPTANSSDPSTFNWASVIFAAVMVAAGVHYALVARKKYVGPVALIQGRRVAEKYARETIEPMMATS